MLGLQKPDGGTVEYYKDSPTVLGEIARYMPRLGVAIADTEFESHLKVKQILRRHGQLYSIKDMSQVCNMADYLDLYIYMRYERS